MAGEHIANARRLRPIIEAAAPSLSDQAASDGAELFPQLKEDGSLVKTGTRINWNGVLKKANADLWDRAENNPDNAPALWADLEYRDGYRVIPEVFTAEKAFALNEVGWWNGTLYRSMMDGNVFTPDVQPVVWELVQG